MANRTFLYSLDHIPGPVGTAPGGDPVGAEVAEGWRGAPLLWLPLFRHADLRHWVDDHHDVEVAVAAKDRALQQLDAALPVLDDLFAGARAFDDYARALRDVLLALPGRNVVWEFTERAMMCGPGEYRAKVGFLLSFLDVPEAAPPAPARNWLAKLLSRPTTDPRVAALRWFAEVSGVEAGHPIGRLRPREERAGDEVEVVTRLLGTSSTEPEAW